jgi:hypothetical protein
METELWLHLKCVGLTVHTYLQLAPIPTNHIDHFYV